MGVPRKSPEEVSEARRKVAWERHHPGETYPGAEADEPETTDPVRLESIADYDGTLGRPRTWQDAKNREAVVGEIIQNEVRRNDARVASGKLFTVEQVRERDQEYDDRVFRFLGEFADFAARLVEPHAKEEARKKAQEFVSNARHLIAEEIKAGRNSV